MVQIVRRLLHGGTRPPTTQRGAQIVARLLHGGRAGEIFTIFGFQAGKMGMSLLCSFYVGFMYGCQLPKIGGPKIENVK